MSGVSGPGAVRGRSAYGTMRSFASSPAALVLVFAWAFLEAIAWPIVPEFLVVLLVLAAPRRVLVLAGIAAVGSVVGGLLSFGIDALGWGDALLGRVPLVTERMADQAAAWLRDAGAAGLLHQPLSGVPYKVFALQASDAGLGPAAFVVMSAVVRGARVVVLSLAFAAGAALTQRWMHRLFAPLCVVYGSLFTAGLLRVVASWR